MKTLKKILAGLFLLIGIPMGLAFSIDLINPNVSQKDKENSITALFLFAIPSTGVGSWFVWSLYQEKQRKKQEIERQREQLFLQLLEEKQGNITITSFALVAQISIEEAKEYLDIKAQQLQANFESTNEGGIIYKFPL